MEGERMVKKGERLLHVEKIEAPKRHICDLCEQDIERGTDYFFLYYSGGSCRRLHGCCYASVAPMFRVFAEIDKKDGLHVGEIQ